MPFDITVSTDAFYLDPHPRLTKISESITELNSWFSNKQLFLNSNKSEVMFVSSPIHLSKSNRFTEVIFDGTNLSVSSKLKILGETFDPSLNFTHTVFQDMQTSNFHLHAIKQVRKFLSFSIAVALTISLVLSRLDYCNYICELPNCLFSKLQSLRNSVAKSALQADYYSSSHARFIDCGSYKLWLTANILYFTQPAYLYELFSIRQAFESLKSSNSGLWLHQPVFLKAFFISLFFAYRSSFMKFFSLNLRLSLSLKHFRKRLKNYFYSRIFLP